jgi:hypothetical protein
VDRVRAVIKVRATLFELSDYRRKLSGNTPNESEGAYTKKIRNKGKG